MASIVTLQTIIAGILFLLFMAGLFLAWYFSHKARVKERMLLIEKGIDLSSLLKSGKFVINFSFPWLKLGILITSISIGCLLGVILWISIKVNNLDTLTWTLMFTFGGIGMILAHYIDKPKAKE
jgi:hypothetical protein